MPGVVDDRRQWRHGLDALEQRRHPVGGRVQLAARRRAVLQRLRRRRRVHLPVPDERVVVGAAGLPREDDRIVVVPTAEPAGHVEVRPSGKRARRLLDEQVDGRRRPLVARTELVTTRTPTLATRQSPPSRRLRPSRATSPRGCNACAPGQVARSTSCARTGPASNRRDLPPLPSSLSSTKTTCVGVAPMFSPLCVCASSQRTSPGASVTSRPSPDSPTRRRSKALSVIITLSGWSCGVVLCPGSSRYSRTRTLSFSKTTLYLSGSVTVGSLNVVPPGR